MAKLSVARINYIKANINAFEPLSYIKEKKGDAPEVKTPGRVTVFNIIDNYAFFRKFGHASAKINIQQSNGDNIIVIEIFSQSPDKTTWTDRTIYLKTTAAHCHKLAI